jgi:hypothetical protein
MEVIMSLGGGGFVVIFILVVFWMWKTDFKIPKPRKKK